MQQDGGERRSKQALPTSQEKMQRPEGSLRQLVREAKRLFQPLTGKLPTLNLT